MHKARPLNGWDSTVTAYLSSRHALGRAFEKEEWVLARVRRFLVQAGADDLDESLFDQWRAQFYQLSSSARVVYERTVYNFCRYRRRSDPGCFLPDAMSLARPRPIPLPTLVEPEQIVRLLGYASGLHPGTCSPLRAEVLRLAIVLLYTAGLRRGELVRLTLGDVDGPTGVLRIRESKFHKSRWVPLSPSARTELKGYLTARQCARLDDRPSAPLLCTAGARGYTGNGLRMALKGALNAVGIRDGNGRCPRVQDFRHNSEARIIPSAASVVFNTWCRCSTCARSGA